MSKNDMTTGKDELDFLREERRNIRSYRRRNYSARRRKSEHESRYLKHALPVHQCGHRPNTVETNYLQKGGGDYMRAVKGLQ